MIDFLKQPWTWYAGGIMIGLIVPALLLLGNKHFGISANLRHICAACFPSDIAFFKYDWKKEAWNLFFVAGILFGGFLAGQLLINPEPMVINPVLVKELNSYGISANSGMMPVELFGWENLLSARSLIMLVGGGFLVGFGTRYAGGCTSGHAIMGLSTLQLPSLIATISFTVGGFIMANLILPFLLQL